MRNKIRHWCRFWIGSYFDLLCANGFMPVIYLIGVLCRTHERVTCTTVVRNLENHDHSMVAALRQERKPVWAGAELTATTLVRKPSAKALRSRANRLCHVGSWFTPSGHLWCNVLQVCRIIMCAKLFRTRKDKSLDAILKYQYFMLILFPLFLLVAASVALLSWWLRAMTKAQLNARFTTTMLIFVPSKTRTA